MKKKLIYLLAIGLIMASCSKKEDPAPTTESLLSQNTWVLNSLTSTDVDFQNSGQVLIGSEWSFKSDKSFALHVNYSGLDFTFSGSWTLSADKKKITLTSNVGGTPSTSELEIISLTASDLQLKESVSGMVNKYTFSKK